MDRWLLGVGACLLLASSLVAQQQQQQDEEGSGNGTERSTTATSGTVIRLSGLFELVLRSRIQWYPKLSAGSGSGKIIPGRAALYQK